MNHLTLRDRIADPVPLGRQILAATGVESKDEYSLFALLPNGDFEDVRLDEAFDLRARGVERFIYFRADRIFKFVIENRQLYWGRHSISGAALIELAELDEDEALFQEVRGGTDLLIQSNAEYDLSASGIERFIVGPNPNATYEIFVNSRPKIVTGRKVTFEQVVEFAFPGPHEPNVIFSMTYRKANSTPHSGELASGGYVLVKKGTIFNVSRTFQS